MGRALVVAIAVLLLLAPGGTSTAGRADEARDRCFPPGSKGLVRSKETRAYRMGRGTVWACDYGTGRRRLLESRAHGLYVYPPPAIALRGELVAFVQEDQSDPVSPFLTMVTVQNVRTGRYPVSSALVDPSHNANTAVVDVVVARDASVAWIACDLGGPNEGLPQRQCLRRGVEMRVYRKPASTNEPEQLDEGAAIDPLSLRLVGPNVKWNNEGAVRVAPIG